MALVSPPSVEGAPSGDQMRSHGSHTSVAAGSTSPSASRPPIATSRQSPTPSMDMVASVHAGSGRSPELLAPSRAIMGDNDHERRSSSAADTFRGKGSLRRSSAGTFWPSCLYNSNLCSSSSCCSARTGSAGKLRVVASAAGFFLRMGMCFCETPETEL